MNQPQQGGEALPRRAVIITLDELPLFAEDREIARAVVGASAEKISHWLESLPLLERDGLPKKHPVYGRYVPAVRQFYDRRYGLPAVMPQQGGRENEKPWPTRKRGGGSSAP